MSDQLHDPAALPLGKEPPALIGQEAAWARAGLDDVQRRKTLTLSGLELRPLCRPARSQSLYRPRSSGSR
jgi:hypothetical protein